MRMIEFSAQSLQSRKDNETESITGKNLKKVKKKLKQNQQNRSD